MTPNVRIGDQVYVKEGSTMFGAVRGVDPHGLTIYVENAGDFRVPSDAIRTVHDGKVLLEAARLPEPLRNAIARAHEKEQPHT